jgi:hypothetical protein
MELNIPGDTFEETPKWWRNFVTDTVHNLPDSINRYNLIDNVLKTQYNAKLLSEGSLRFIKIIAVKFIDDKHMTLFLLKWS